jgi:streptogramin lyase
VSFKLDHLPQALGSFEDFIDASVFADLAGNLRSAAAAFVAFESSGSRELRDDVAAALGEFRDTIDQNPEAFDNTGAGHNVSGELIARAASALFILPKAPTASGPVITEFPLPTGSGPWAIVTGPDGNLWFTHATGVGKITTSGDVTLYTAPGSGQYRSIAVGPDGNLWFTDIRAPRVLRATTDGVITSYPLPNPANSPWFIVSATDGNLWFTETNPDHIDRIGRLDPATGIVTDIELPPLANPPGFIWGLAQGADGNFWYGRGQTIGRMTPAGVVTEFPVPSANSAPTHTVAAPDGNVWFTENAVPNVGRITPSGVITEFPSPPHPASRLFAAAIGPDGNVWFSNELADLIGRITPSGVITEFPIPTPGGYVLGLTTGPDGNLWFTETVGNKIGRLSQ